MSIQLRDGLSDQSIDLVLEDLLVRFLVNVPEEDLSSIERVFFQVEEAQWFYTDFIRQLNPLLPGMKMKSFAAKFLEKCPLIWKWGDPEDAIARFGKYKSTIPVRGVALFNKDLSKVILVQGTESNSWSFPRGKISKAESDIDCAVRETEEETGFNVRDLIDENDFVERTIRGKNYKIYLVKNVPEDYNFSPLGRNEISKIEWFDMKAIQKRCKNNPNSLFIVGTILKPMVKWINKNKGVLDEEEMMWKAEVRLKDLLGIGARKHENPDAGRELLNILQHVNGNPTPNVAPTIHLPQHLQSLPMFNMAPSTFPFYPNMLLPNGFPNPMGGNPTDNGFVNVNPNFQNPPHHFQNPPNFHHTYPNSGPNFHNPAQNAHIPPHTSSDQTPSSSKELLSILNTKSDTKCDRDRGANSQDSKNNRSKAQNLLSLFKKHQEETGDILSDENASKSLLSVLNRKEDPLASQTMMNILKKEPETSSQTLLGILNKKKNNEDPKDANKSNGNGQSKAYNASNGSNHPILAHSPLPAQDISQQTHDPAFNIQAVDGKRPFNHPPLGVSQPSNELEESIIQNDTNRFGSEPAKKLTLLKRPDRMNSPRNDTGDLLETGKPKIASQATNKSNPAQDIMNLIGKPPSKASPSKDIMNLIGQPPKNLPSQDIMNLIGQPPKNLPSKDIMNLIGQPPKDLPSQDILNLIGKPPQEKVSLPSQDILNLIGKPSNNQQSKDLLNLIGKPAQSPKSQETNPPNRRKSQLSTDLLSLLKKPEQKANFVLPSNELLGMLRRDSDKEPAPAPTQEQIAQTAPTEISPFAEDDFESFENFDDFDHLNDQFYRKSLFHNFDIASDEEDVDHLLDEFSDSFVPTSTDLPDAAYSKPPNYYQEQVDSEPTKNHIRLLNPGESLNQVFYDAPQQPEKNIGGQSLLALLNGKKSPGNDSMNDSYQSIYGNTTQTGQESNNTPNLNNPVHEREFNRSSEIMKELFWKRDH
jgi:mRNA-decapping enzyme subunit 2